MNTKKNKNVKERNIKNEIVKYNITINANVSFKEIIREKDYNFTITKSGSFSTASQNSTTRNNEKNLISLDKFEELVHIGDHFDYVHTIQDVLDDIPAVLLSYENALKFQNGVKLDFDIKTLDTKNILFISENGPLGVGKINNNKINPIRIFNIVGKRDVDK